MHFIVNKSLFQGALQKLIGVIPSKTSVPILSSLLLELTDNKLILTGTDLEISISTEIDVQMKEEGAITIPAKLLSDIVRELPDVPIEMSSDSKYNITLKTEKGLYRLAGESKNEFPNIIIEENDGEIFIEADKLQRMINKTIFAVTTDELRVTLMGVLFQILENEIRLVATDGHRLSRISNKDFSSDLFEKDFIIPAKALNLILKNLESLAGKKDQNISILIGDSHTIFRWEGTSIYSKLIEGKYPKYENVIPFDNEYRLLVNRESLISSVRRVSIFSNSITHQVRFIISEKEMEIRSEDVEFGGEANENLPVDYTGENMEIGFNANYILDMIKNIEADEIVLLLKSSKNAGLIYPPEQKKGEDLLMLLMPIRLSED